jgi:peptide chain release factor subunit 3
VNSKQVCFFLDFKISWICKSPTNLIYFSGFEKGGQTREHALLVKTQGIKRLIIAVNKMDDTNWDINRYNEILEKMKPWLLKQVGFKKEQLHFIPLSGFSGVNVKDSDISKHPWYKGPSLLDYLNDLPAIERKTTGQVRFCVCYAPLKKLVIRL